MARWGALESPHCGLISPSEHKGPAFALGALFVCLELLQQVRHALLLECGRVQLRTHHRVAVRTQKINTGEMTTWMHPAINLGINNEIRDHSVTAWAFAMSHINVLVLISAFGG
jgi:hypothetical protein